MKSYLTEIFLIAIPLWDNNYDYYCEPHASMGMLGVVRVNRSGSDLYTRLTGWQVVPQTISEEEIFCDLDVNGAETEVSIVCDHNIASITGLLLHLGVVEAEGASFCMLSNYLRCCDNLPSYRFAARCIVCQGRIY